MNTFLRHCAATLLSLLPLGAAGCADSRASDPREKLASVSSADSCGAGFFRPQTLPLPTPQSSTLTPGPTTVNDAIDTFDQRAQAVLQWSACSDTSAERDYTSSNGQDWLYSAIGHLGYRGACPGDTDAVSGSAKRRADVDSRLSTIANTCPVRLLGSDFGAEWMGLGVERTGELDFDLLALLPIAYLYRRDLPTSYSHILDFLKESDSGPDSEITIEVGVSVENAMALLGAAAPLLPIAAFHAHIPESENHLLLIQSSKYLTNQLIFNSSTEYPAYTSDPAYDNTQNGMKTWILQHLQGILQTDFHEYNSKPYARYSIDAIENLAEFAADKEVRTAALLVMNWTAAKFAVSSSLLRRNSPYRRRESMDSQYYTGLVPPTCEPNDPYCGGARDWSNNWDADAYACWFPLYSGQTEVFPTLNQLPSCGSLSRRAVGSYRIHPLILDLAMRKDVPYFQTFSGGPNYLASHAQGTAEVYDNEGPFLIASGGLPTNNGLGIDIFMGPVNLARIYPWSGEDVGVSVPTVLLPNGGGDGITSSISDRTNLIRFEYSSDTHGKDFNDCVTRGFACGAKPTIPPALCPDGSCDDGPWSFVRISNTPLDDIFVAMLGRGKAFGFFEAVPAATFGGDFGRFTALVKANNPSGAGAITGSGPGYMATYVRTDGSPLSLSFLIDPSSGTSASSFAPGQSIPGSGDPAAWGLADGPVQSDGHSGYITLTSPHYSGKCIIDMRDVNHPSWSCPHFDDIDGDGVPDEKDNCVAVPNAPVPSSTGVLAQEDANLVAERLLGRPLRGDACDDNPTTTIGLAESYFSDGLIGPCNEVLVFPGGGSSKFPNGTQCPMALSSVLTMDSRIGNKTGDAAPAWGTTTPAACPCSDAEGLCFGAQTGCSPANDSLFPSPGHEQLGGSQWYYMTQFTPGSLAKGGTPDCVNGTCLSSFPYSGPYSAVLSLFQEERDDRPFTPATVMSNWDFVKDLPRMNMAGATSASATIWSHVSTFSPAEGEHEVMANISNSYVSAEVTISQGMVVREAPGPASVPWYPWDAVDPMSWATIVGDPASPDPIVVIQRPGEAIASAATLGMAGAASSLVSGVVTGTTQLLVSADVHAGAGAGRTAAPFAVTVSRGSGQVMGTLSLGARTLTGVAVAAPAFRAAIAESAAPLLAYGSGVGQVFALSVSSGAATLAATDVALALQGASATTVAAITGDVSVAPLALTWDGPNGRALVLDSVRGTCGQPDTLRLLAIAPGGASSTLWTAAPSIAAAPTAAFLSLNAAGEVIVSLSGVPRPGRSEVVILDASGRPVSSADYDGALVGPAVGDANAVALPLAQSATGSGASLAVAQVARSSQSAGAAGAAWLGGVSDATLLSAPGTEQCAAITPSSFNAVLALLAQAKASVLGAPSADAQAMADAIDSVANRLTSSATWLASGNLDGTNASAAAGMMGTANGALTDTLTQASAASKSAASGGGTYASAAFEALVSAASQLSEMGTAAGRCYMDSEASWSTWSGDAVVALPPTPAACGGLGIGSVDAVLAVLDSSIAYERAELAANPDQGADEYGQFDIDISTQMAAELTSLRASLATSGLTGADAATAAAIEATFAHVAGEVGVGGQEATYVEVWLPGPARNSFEADRRVTAYAIALAAEAGRCSAMGSQATCATRARAHAASVK